MLTLLVSPTLSQPTCGDLKFAYRNSTCCSSQGGAPSDNATCPTGCDEGCPYYEGTLMDPDMTLTLDPRLHTSASNFILLMSASYYDTLTVIDHSQDRNTVLAQMKEVHDSVKSQMGPVSRGLIEPFAPWSKIENPPDAIKHKVDEHVDVYVRRENEIEPQPCLLYFHGGGISFFEAENFFDRTLAEWLAGQNITTINVEFRNVGIDPKSGDIAYTPFPAFRDDAMAALEWTRSQSMCSSIVAGGSSGGSRVAVYLQKHVKETGGPPLDGLWLNQAWLANFDADHMLPSTVENRNYELPMNFEYFKFFKDFLFDGQDDPMSAMYDHPETELSGFPPTMIDVGGLDPGQSWAQKFGQLLSKHSGNSVALYTHSMMSHSMTDITSVGDEMHYQTSLMKLVAFIQSCQRRKIRLSLNR